MVINAHNQHKSRTGTNRNGVTNRPESEISEQEADGATIPQRVRSAQEQTSPDNAWTESDRPRDQVVIRTWPHGGCVPPILRESKSNTGQRIHTYY